MKLCGSCQAYGKLMMSGAKIESVKGSVADVTIMTSDKPELVAEIKAFAQKNRDEMVKMEKAEKAKMEKPEQKEKAKKS